MPDTCELIKRRIMASFIGKNLPLPLVQYRQKNLRLRKRLLCQLQEKQPGQQQHGSAGHPQTATNASHGIRNLKKLVGCEALIGMMFEKEPVPSSVPVLFVVQLTGGDRLVVLSQV
jgi:hypothetical protein